MQCTRISDNIQKTIGQIIMHNQPLHLIVQAIAAAQGRSLLVGGAVRDLVLGLPLKDLDIEVHSLTLAQLETILKSYGHVSVVGKSFGVLKLHGMDVDWSLPRRDSAGRKPHVIVDPAMSIEEAFKRRDLTINAMGIDLITYELIDPFGGLQDLHNKILRAPDEQLFKEDPLRFYRVMQFIGRFAMQPDSKLNKICADMDLVGVSVERIEQEFEKLCLRSVRPSLGIVWLDTIGRLTEIFPELAALKNVPQDPKWHPEGDVFEHTMQTFDAAVALSYASDYDALICIYGALCHDLGKATTTELIDGRYKSLRHEIVGVPIAQKLLKRITGKKELIKAVGKLVKYHMVPWQLVQSGVRIAAYKRLALKLAPEATLQMLVHVALADKRGRNPQRGSPLTVSIEIVDIFLRKAQGAAVLDAIEKPVLLGRDLLDVVAAGPALGALLKRAYQIQIDENITDKEILKKRVLQQE